MVVEEGRRERDGEIELVDTDIGGERKEEEGKEGEGGKGRGRDERLN